MKKKQRKIPILHIEDVIEPHFKRRTVCLLDYAPEVASEWYYKKNCGFGPEDFARASGVKAWWICSDCSRIWKAQINNRTMLKAGCPYCEHKLVCEETSLLDNYPGVAREWHEKRNGKLKPSDVMSRSGKRVWWKCEKGHEWQAVISTRTIGRSRCPHCHANRMQYAREHPRVRIRGRVVLKPTGKPSRKFYERGGRAFSTLAESFPEIADQWHPTKNGKWKPSDFGRASEAIAWWKCDRAPDHEWQSPIYARTINDGRGCPFCAGRRVAKSNALATLRPELAKRWHPTKNGDLKPTAVTVGSAKKIWWKCPKGSDHVWQAPIGNMARDGQGCPFCCSQKIGKDNSLAVLCPDVAAEWHPRKNGKLLPTQVARASSKKVWWRCSRNSRHEWEASIGNRTYNGSGCPFCTGRRACPENSLKAGFPRIAREWHPKRNGILTPADVTAHSKRVVWWECANGHEWKQAIGKRTRHQAACRFCRGRS